ncbi:MAG: Bax inhibitor-1/YccA family protein [Firmicutes bacterium]|nr:Bax inhibitor-1/YccA family protein [Bacillota bacterium]
MNDFMQYDQNYASKLNTSLMYCYLWMFVGLMLTAMTSIFLYSTNLLLFALVRMPFLMTLILIAQLGVVFAMSFFQRKLSATALKVMFVLYSLLTGVTFTTLGYVYPLGTIGLAFIVSAVFFLSLFAVGMTTKKDFSNIGMICIAALFALVVTQIIMMIFRVSMDTRIMSMIGLLIFTGITIWDVQRARVVLGSEMLYGEEQDKAIIFFALNLYLDLINIFLKILSLLNKKK